MEDQNENQMQNQETSESSSESNSNKTMIMIVAAVGVIIIVVGALFLKRGRSASEGATNTNVEEGMMVEDEEGMMEGDEEMMVSDEESMMEGDEGMMEGEARDITVNGFSFGYTPSALTMAAGEKIRLTFVADDALHDFIIEGTDIATEQVQGGSQTVIEFTAPEEPGEYTFYCSVGNHRAQGMEGTLTVE